VIESSPPSFSLRRIPISHAAFLLIIAGIYVWAAYHSNGMYPDTPRDFYFAQKIALGHEFPLNGPAANNTFHLGPLWFYILALPLWLTALPGSVVFTTGLLGASKFFLYYRLGWLFDGPRAAMIFVLASLYPGWSSFTLVSLTHTMVVEATTILGIFAALHVRKRQTPLSFCLLGLTISLMLHAHPTTFVAALLIGAFAFWVLPSWKKRSSFVFWSAVFALLPFLPMIVGQILNGCPDITSLAAYSNKEPLTLSLERFTELCAALFLYGAHYVARFWLELTELSSWLLIAFLSVSLLLVAAGVYRYAKTSTRKLKIVIALFFFIVLQTLAIMLMRSVTPYWFSFSYIPAMTILCAIGLNEFFKRQSHVLPAATLVLWFIWSMAGFIYIGKEPHRLFVETPPPRSHTLMNISDLRFINDGKYVTAARFPVSDLFAVTADLCQPAQIYGHYPLFIDATFGAGLEKCQTPELLKLGGHFDKDDHLLLIGLRDYAWEESDMEALSRIGSFGTVVPRKSYNETSLPMALADPNIFPPTNRQPGVIEQRHYEISVPGKESLLIACRSPAFSIENIMVNGKPISPAYSDNSNTIVLSSPQTLSAENNIWTFDIKADQKFVDIVSF